MSKKLYPFSMRKHGHDLEFRRNRAMNELWAKQDAGTLSAAEERQYEELIDRLAEITLHYPDSNGIVWLNGRDWALAHESMMWAEAERGHASHLLNCNACRI